MTFILKIIHKQEEYLKYKICFLFFWLLAHFTFLSESCCLLYFFTFEGTIEEIRQDNNNTIINENIDDNNNNIVTVIYFIFRVLKRVWMIFNISP